jgi:hypothetical protein
MTGTRNSKGRSRRTDHPSGYPTAVGPIAEAAGETTAGTRTKGSITEGFGVPAVELAPRTAPRGPFTAGRFASGASMPLADRGAVAVVPLADGGET